MMISGVVLALLIVACVAMATESAPGTRAGKVSIGWASADITPAEPAALCGQFHLRISKQVNDPLSATALAIEAGDAAGVLDHAVMVSADVACIRRRDLERVANGPVLATGRVRAAFLPAGSCVEDALAVESRAADGCP